ncbi:MAG: hypothetical protein NZL96_01450 [Patescibacteria group bacterium]|nr:hypothetical protein [Patescibacteria group bacterium]
MKTLVGQVIKELKRNSLDYLILVLGGFIFLIFLSLFQGERLINFLIIVAFAGFYILWGIYHHSKKDFVKGKILIEYILIAFTVLFLLKIILVK